MDVIDRINLMLSVMGKTGAEMSRDLGLSNGTYSQWNTRKTKPSNKTLALIAPYLGTTVEYLLTGTEQQKKPAPVWSELNEKNKGLIIWFRSLPPEKQRALLIAQDGPVELADE